MLTADRQRPTATRPRRRRASAAVKVIGGLGKLFVGAGIVVLLFTGYLLWGTGVYTKQQQGHLKEKIAADPLISESELRSGEAIPSARPDSEPALGDPLFSIKVPKIGLDAVVVNGVRVDDLKKGRVCFPHASRGRAAMIAPTVRSIPVRTATWLSPGTAPHTARHSSV